MSTEKAELVRVFFHTGENEGIREADIALSTVKAIAFNKESIEATAKKVPELRKPGVYILIGENKNAYIGESENVYNRLKKDHANSAEKDFWTKTIVLATKDDWLSKGHIVSIEKKLIDKARNGEWGKENIKGGSENAGSLSAGDRAIIDRFIDQAITLVEMLGCDIFTAKTPTNSGLNANRIMKSHKFDAKAVFYEDTGILLVLAGSKAKHDEADKIPPSASSKRTELIENKFLIEVMENGTPFFEFKVDVEFKSLSAAAAVIAGCSVAGTDAWKPIDQNAAQCTLI